MCWKKYDILYHFSSELLIDDIVDIFSTNRVLLVAGTSFFGNFFRNLYSKIFIGTFSKFFLEQLQFFRQLLKKVLGTFLEQFFRKLS